ERIAAGRCGIREIYSPRRSICLKDLVVKGLARAALELDGCPRMGLAALSQVLKYALIKMRGAARFGIPRINAKPSIGRCSNIHHLSRNRLKFVFNGRRQRRTF